MSEKRVPYWEFMRQGYDNLKRPRTAIELDRVIRDMEEQIKETNKVVEELREKIRRHEELLASQGIVRD